MSLWDRLCSIPKERWQRAENWPITLVHYFRLIWKVRAEYTLPLSIWEVYSLAHKHTHQYIWYRIRYDDYTFQLVGCQRGGRHES
jgi:hypothetical protein